MAKASSPDASPRAQRDLVGRWAAALGQAPAIDVIWLEGSLVGNRANPWSDIDLRIAVADEAHLQVWDVDRLRLLEGMGEHLLLLGSGWLRAITADGIIAELLAYKTSEIDSLELYEWEIFFSRLPEPRPMFRKLPDMSAAETWPAPEWSAREVGQWTKELLGLMAAAPQDFHRGEECAAAYALDYLRNGLFRLMYQRLGIRISKRAKHLSQIFPADFIADLKRTYTEAGESPLALPAVAAAQIRAFAVFEKHLQALSDQLGGGFEPAWYRRLFEKTAADLQHFTEAA